MANLDEAGGANPIGDAFAEFVEEEMGHYVGQELTPQLVKRIANIVSTYVVDFVGITESGNMLGVSKQRVDQMANEGKMPPIAGEINAGKFWLWMQIDEMANSYTPHSGRPKS